MIECRPIYLVLAALKSAVSTHCMTVKSTPMQEHADSKYKTCIITTRVEKILEAGQ